MCALLAAAGEFPHPAAGGASDTRAPMLEQQLDAARLMARSLVTIKASRVARGLAIDRAIDPNETGIIGDEFSPLTTSLGDVEAKRTTTNPAFAALLVKYFREAGLSRGDVVAVGASGSFPSFLLATLSASRILDLDPVVIYSVGASMYGANLPGFTFVDMLDGLRATGLLPYRLTAVSPGGYRDEGKGVLFDEGGTTLIDETRRSGLPIIDAPSLSDSIRARLRVYDQARPGRPVRCFVNIGGAAASFGNTPASLTFPNGLVRRLAEVPPDPTRGLVFEFASRGVPVIHLLFVRGLARDNQLPYDPVPLPPVGDGGVYERGPSRP